MFLITSYSLGHSGIYDDWVEGPNSAGLFGIQLNVLYRGGKTIKYCLITCVPINAVGDCVACLSRRYVEAEFKITGPITSGTYTWTFDDGWYNSTIDSVNFEQVELQYMDGSTETISAEKLENDLRYTIEQQKRQEKLQEQYRRQKMSALDRLAEDNPAKFWGYFAIFFIALIAVMMVLFYIIVELPLWL